MWGKKDIVNKQFSAFGSPRRCGFVGSQQAGRHRAAKHAAPKKKRQVSKKSTVAFSIVGLAGVSATSGSTIAFGTGSTAQTLAEGPSTKSIPLTKTVVLKRSTSRAKAASRSDSRITLSDAADLQAAGDTTTSQNTATTSVSSSERQALLAVTDSSLQLNYLVGRAQAQAESQALQIANAERARAAAVAAAEVAARDKARAALIAHTSVGDFSDQPSSTATLNADLVSQIGKVVAPIGGGYKLSARFGQRGWMWSSGWHTGLDFDVPAGTDVRAAAGGVIIAAGWDGRYGNRIEIDHGNGIITTYNHLSKVSKTSGWVDAGDYLGKSGATGNVTGPHLHFEVTQNGDFVNPSTFLWGSR